MPTSSLSINGVLYTDTHAFMREFHAVRERDFSAVFAQLEAFVADEGLPYDDSYDNLPFVEAVSPWNVDVPIEDTRWNWRMPKADKWTNYKSGRTHYKSKRKEVK